MLDVLPQLFSKITPKLLQTNELYRCECKVQSIHIEATSLTEDEIKLMKDEAADSSSSRSGGKDGCVTYIEFEEVK